jgi:D-threo-aldose 1-dehydrogenase
VFDYSYDGAMRALEDSLQRLGMDRVDLLLIHAADPSVHGAERFPAIFREVMTGAYRALEALRAQRVVAGIGAGLNLAETCLEFARAGSFDLFLLSGRYTLAEQGALEGFLPYCEEQGISVVVGSPFNSGILASGATADARYEYRTAPPEVAARVKAISELCGRHGVPLGAAALQFPLAHPAVVSVVPGLRSPAEVQAALAAMRLPIPSQLWDDLKGSGLLQNDAPTPAGAET